MAKAKKESATIKVTLVRSLIGRIEAHKASVRGLGLRRMHHTVEVQDTPETRGMSKKSTSSFRSWYRFRFGKNGWPWSQRSKITCWWFS